MIRGGESVFGMGKLCSVRRCEPVGGSKVLSTFVRQFDRSGTLSAGRQAPCAQTSRLRSLSLFVLSFAGLPVLPQRFVPLTTSSLRGSRSLFELSAFLPCSLVTAPRVAFVGGLLMPSARSSLGSLVIGGGGGASSSCYRRAW